MMWHIRRQECSEEMIFRYAELISARHCDIKPNASFDMSYVISTQSQSREPTSLDIGWTKR